MSNQLNMPKLKTQGNLSMMQRHSCFLSELTLSCHIRRIVTGTL